MYLEECPCVKCGELTYLRTTLLHSEYPDKPFCVEHAQELIDFPVKYLNAQKKIINVANVDELNGAMIADINHLRHLALESGTIEI